MDEFNTAARFIHFATVMLLFGASLFRLYAGTGPPREGEQTHASAAFDRWLRFILILAALGALLSALAWLDSLAVRMGRAWSEALNPETVGAVLFATQFGSVWVWRL